MTASTARPAPVYSTKAPNPSVTPQPCAEPRADSSLSDEIPTPTTRSRLSVPKPLDPLAHEHTVRLSAIDDHVSFIQDTYERISALYAVLSQRLDQLVVKRREAESRCSSLQGTVASLQVDMERLKGEKRVLEGALEDAGASWTATEAALAKDLAYAQCMLNSERTRRREADELVAELQVSVGSANDAVQLLQNNLHTVHHETQGLQDENVLLRDMVDKLEARSKQAQGHQRTIVDMFKAYKDDKEERLADLGRELGEMCAGRQAVTDELRQAEVRSMEEIRDVRDALQASQATISSLDESNTVLKSRLAELEGELEEARGEVERSRREAAAAQEETDATKTELRTVELERKQLSEERDSLLSTVGGHKAALADARGACEALQKSRNALEEELQRQVRDHDNLTQEIEALQKSCDAIRAREGQARADADTANTAVRAMEARVKTMVEDVARRVQHASDDTATVTAATAKVTAPAGDQATAAPPGSRKRQGGVSASAAQLISKRRARSSQMT